LLRRFVERTSSQKMADVSNPIEAWGQFEDYILATLSLEVGFGDYDTI